MTRILVTREDGSVIWNEGVNAADFETKHFRLALADRLGWAVADADRAVTPSFAAMGATRPHDEPASSPAAEPSSSPAIEAPRSPAAEPSSSPAIEAPRSPERELVGAL